MAYTPSQILDGLVLLLKSITAGNGYLNTLESAKVYKGYVAAYAQDQRDSTFSKAFAFFDYGQPTNRIAGQVEEELVFIVVILVKEIPGGYTDAQEAVLSFREDLLKALRSDSTLGGRVNEIQLEEWAVDGGVLDPIGVIACRLVAHRIMDAI